MFWFWLIAGLLLSRRLLVIDGQQEKTLMNY